ncbi:MAG: sigma-70 family RNA polymerase sigma factor [Chitinophagaceae bacterium]|nr:sigma-70 family RNA polymerase sigma factor [Chitinophagaceae bacterium]
MTPYSQYDDQQLLALLRTSDEQAFTVIYQRYWESLFYKAGKKLNNLPEAENIVQDIFTDIWNRRMEINVTGELSHYLSLALKYRIINYQARMRHAEYYSLHQSRLEISDRNTEEWLAYSELNRRMAALVKALPEKCQLAFRLREKGLSQKEIAETMQVSENTVETHIGRALKALRTGLTQLFSLF